MPTTHDLGIQTCTVWVCADCAESEAGVLDPAHQTDRDPWGLLPNEDVTPGLLVEGHSDDCPNVDHRTGEWFGDTDCDCETADFAWWPCEGCGSTLGGTRHAYTLWL